MMNIQTILTRRRNLAQLLVLAVALVALSPNVYAASSTTITKLDTAGVVGNATSIAIGTDGIAII